LAQSDLILPVHAGSIARRDPVFSTNIQLVILTPKFRLEVLIANPRFEDFDVSAVVWGDGSLPGTG
jgi:hypothetical protein